MMARRHAYLVVLLIASGSSQVFAQGQQGLPPPGATTQTRPGGRGASTTPQPAAAAPLPQGFSVVLVLGDIQVAAPAQDDVPPAARKALADMKDFLPYKSYRLLDAAWVLCCGRDHRTSALSERNLVAEFGGGASAVTQMRGPDSKEYELHLRASRGEGSRTFVRFSLMESADSTEPEEAMSVADVKRRKELADLQSKAEALQKQMQTKREAGRDAQSIETELGRTEARINELSARAVLEASRRQQSGNRAVIDTSFTMDLGETVVVGTSRLKAGTRALIALLTAVPAKSSARTPDEAR
jgi:hypothetical protein